MPVYEFNCSKCGDRFEVMGSYAEREKEHACPKCGSTEVKQAISTGRVRPMDTMPQLTEADVDW